MRLITVAIHTAERAVELKSLLESEGIPVVLQNVNLENPEISSGMRVRIPEKDLPLALRIIENREIFKSIDAQHQEASHDILVPVDFSEYSLKAVGMAMRVAHAHNADIVLMHCYIDPYVGSNVQFSDALTFDLSAESEARKQIEQTAKAQMSNFAKRVRALIKSGDFAPVKFTTEIAEGVPEDVIEEYSKNHTPYLIVMGTRGTDRKTGEMIGSVTAEVIDKCRVSVVTVPEPFEFTAVYRPDKVLFIANLDQGDILALDTYSRIFEGVNAKVIITEAQTKRRPFEKQISGAVKDNLAGLRQYCEKNYPQFTFKYAHINVDKSLDSLVELARQNDINIIVVPNKRRRKLLGRLFNPGIAQRLIMSVDLPMLVIRV